MKTYTVEANYTLSIEAENIAEAIQKARQSICLDDLAFYVEGGDEEEDFDEFEEPDLEMGYDPYMGCYSWDC